MNTDTQITIFGATGRVGRQITAQLLARGCRVVAATHGGVLLPAHDNLSTVVVDVYDPTSVAQALHGSTVVISALGSWGTPRKDILTAGMLAIIPAMQAQSLTRIVSLTGAEARARGDRYGVVHRLMHAALLVMAPKILRDGEQHIALLQASGLNWTVVRSPIMSGRRMVGVGTLSTHRPLPWQRISRQAVSAAMVQLLDDDQWQQQAPYIR